MKIYLCYIRNNQKIAKINGCQFFKFEIHKHKESLDLSVLQYSMCRKYLSIRSHQVACTVPLPWRHVATDEVGGLCIQILGLSSQSS